MNGVFLITIIAGFSTLIGAIPIFINFRNENNIISNSLAFSSGVMTAISILSLIPTSFIGLLDSYNFLFSVLLIALFISLGISFSIIINRLLPSNSDKLYKTGIFSMIAIILHNIPEGIVTFLTAKDDFKMGIVLAIAIGLHNIPEGISISIPIYYSTRSKFKSILYTFISGISELFGALLAFLFLSNITTIYIDYMYAFIAGIMISLVFYELLPNAVLYRNKMSTLLYFILGFIFMYIISYIV